MVAWFQRFFAKPEWGFGRRLAVGAAVGLVTGLVAVIFRLMFTEISDSLLKTDGEGVAKAHNWVMFIVPTVGGLLVGLLTLLFFGRGGIPGVADVILAQTRDRGVMGWLDGIKALLINLLALGTGASVGREGPLVHVGATLGSIGGVWLRVNDTNRRIYVACGVAAGVAASFDAPLAGLFFAVEIALGGLTSLSLTSLGPVVLSAIAGTMVSRVLIPADKAFVVNQSLELSPLEFPAFILLGLVCAVVSTVFLAVIRRAWKIRRSLERILPLWVHPALAGMAIGVIALSVPEVLGVGYVATFQSLSGAFDESYLVVLLSAKFLAVVLCLSLGFGSGVFSPSLMMGALLGVLFGQIATQIAPQFPADSFAYGYAGMGAMVGAILGAPLSTILMVFELTGDYSVTVAVMLSVVVSAQLTHAIIGNTFFGLQLEQRSVRMVLGG